MDHRLARRVHQGTPGQGERRLQVVPMPYDYELQQGLPERFESRKANCQDQGDGMNINVMKRARLRSTRQFFLTTGYRYYNTT
mmetsp:Transcript_5729/g.20737  ORF Transcript_5729/g.20737 Transcript_5729/m.20737 type:complete len:83 (-) Transcript_5729:79-327(-)